MLEDEFQGCCYKFEGHLIESYEKLGVVTRDSSRSPMKRGTRSDETGEAKLIECLMGDRSGPVNVTLWDETAVSFLSLWEQF